MMELAFHIIILLDVPSNSGFFVLFCIRFTDESAEMEKG